MALVGGFYLALQGVATAGQWALPMEIIAVILVMAGLGERHGRWSIPAVCRRFAACVEDPKCRPPPIELTNYDVQDIVKRVAENADAARAFCVGGKWNYPGHQLEDVGGGFLGMHVGNWLSGTEGHNDIEAVGLIANFFADLSMATSPGERGVMMAEIFRHVSFQSCDSHKLWTGSNDVATDFEMQKCTLCWARVVYALTDAVFDQFLRWLDATRRSKYELLEGMQYVYKDICKRVAIGAEHTNDARILRRVLTLINRAEPSQFRVAIFDATPRFLEFIMNSDMIDLVLAAVSYTHTEMLELCLRCAQSAPRVVKCILTSPLITDEMRMDFELRMFEKIRPVDFLGALGAGTLRPYFRASGSDHKRKRSPDLEDDETGEATAAAVSPESPPDLGPFDPELFYASLEEL